ncbi:MAG: hypothetical protein ABL888_05055 [Pirellulaceae bacterium]
MLDRESTFADKKIVAMLKEDFVPVAIDQWYTRRQKDTEGDFYRKIAGQGPRNDFKATTQGLYIADPAGKLIAYNNNRGPERIRKLLESALANYTAPDCEPLDDEKIDQAYDPKLPVGAAVVRCGTKVEGGYEKTDDQWQQIFQKSVARDNLWILKSEIEALAKNEMPPSLARRIARFHLTDNTRGQPPVWDKKDVKDLAIKIEDGKVTGSVHLENENGSRGYIAKLTGVVTMADGVLKCFDVVAKGEYWGAGQYTLKPPSGRFPLVVAFRLPTEPDTADLIPPHGSRGWLDGYLNPDR